MTVMVENNDLEQRKAALKATFKNLAVLDPSGKKINIGVHHFRQEIRLDYSQEDYAFAHGDFLIDEDKEDLAMFVGVGKVMDDIHGEVPWFLFEKSKEIKFFDAARMPPSLRRNFVPLR